MTEPQEDISPLPEYPLSPEEPPPPIVKAAFPATANQPAEPPVEAESAQFSLSEMLWLVALAAVILSAISSVARWTTLGQSPGQLWAISATLLGLAALLGVVVMSWISKARPILLVGWWVLFGLYIISAATAVLMSK